jgi:hypothetical protein
MSRFPPSMEIHQRFLQVPLDSGHAPQIWSSVSLYRPPRCWPGQTIPRNVPGFGGTKRKHLRHQTVGTCHRMGGRRACDLHGDSGLSHHLPSGTSHSSWNQMPDLTATTSPMNQGSQQSIEWIDSRNEDGGRTPRKLGGLGKSWPDTSLFPTRSCPFSSGW